MAKLPKIVSISVDLSKIDPSRIVEGKNGARYVDMTLVNTPDNQFGKDYMVKQDFGKEAREQKIETPILGNGKAFLVDQGRQNGDSPDSGSSSPSVSSSSSLTDLPWT